MIQFLRAHLVKLLAVALVAFISAILVFNYLFLNKKTAPKSKATGETVALSFSPESHSGAGTFSSKVVAKPSTDVYVRGYEMKINFDKTKVQVTAIQYNLGTVSNGLGDDTTIDANKAAINERGYIKIQGELQTGTGQLLTSSQNTDVVTVTFNRLSTTGSSTITINSADVKFYIIESPTSVIRSITSTGNIQFSINSTTPTATHTPTPLPTVTPPPGATNTPTPPPGATNTPTPLPTATPPPGATNTPTPPPGATNTPTPSPAPTGTVTLNLKLKLQGITKKPETNSIAVRVKLGGLPPATEYQTGSFTADDKGVLSGSASFNAPPGPGYTVFVKGPKHIQKKICAALPAETAAGTYHCSQGTITLAAGVNTFDFSGVMLMAGDLPDQDGVVNSYDTSLVRNNLGKKDADAVRLADINLDGIVDTQDYSMIIYALSVRGDEE